METQEFKAVRDKNYGLTQEYWTKEWFYIKNHIGTYLPPVSVNDLTNDELVQMLNSVGWEYADNKGMFDKQPKKVTRFYAFVDKYFENEHWGVLPKGEFPRDELIQNCTAVQNLLTKTIYKDMNEDDYDD